LIALSLSIPLTSNIQEFPREFSYNIHMITTKTLLLTIFVPLACLKIFGFYKKILKVSAPSLKEIKAKLERSFSIDS
tara:strand:+ start:283 stop:513 length:231 start_codon:yes stop_codon:yes gene_type:complete